MMVPRDSVDCWACFIGLISKDILHHKIILQAYNNIVLLVNVKLCLAFFNMVSATSSVNIWVKNIGKNKIISRLQKITHFLVLDLVTYFIIGSN